MDSPWEPYQFKIGDKVRVHLSAECTMKGSSRDRLTGLVMVDVPDHGHDPKQDGRTGTVGRPPGSKLKPPHSICVWFDQPYYKGPTEKDWVFGAAFAGAELELIEEHPPVAGGS